MTEVPSEEELSAIGVALGHLVAKTPAGKSLLPPPWAFAMRVPDLEIEDLRAIARAGRAAACSTRF